MSQLTMFFTSIGISILFGTLISLYLRKPLHTLLVDVCGTPDRAVFWTQVTILSYLLVSAAIGLSFRPEYEYVSVVGYSEYAVEATNEGEVTEYGVRAVNEGQVYYSLGRHLGRTLLGLLLTTGFMAFTISLFIRRQERNMPLNAQG